MTTDLWLSVGLGAGIGMMYDIVSFVTARWALRYSGKRFLIIFFGGMLARLGAAVVVVTLALLLLPVTVFAFVIAFLIVYVVWLVIEVWLIHTGRLSSVKNSE